MSFVLGMTLTAILLIGCAGGGIWYWLKIKEAPKKIKQDKSPLAGNKKEPFLRSEKEKEIQSVRQSSEAVNPSSSQTPVKDAVQKPTVPMQATPSSALLSRLNLKQNQLRIKSLRSILLKKQQKPLKNRNNNKCRLRLQRGRIYPVPR